jgi:hypothetical protein
MARHRSWQPADSGRSPGWDGIHIISAGSPRDGEAFGAASAFVIHRELPRTPKSPKCHLVMDLAIFTNSFSEEALAGAG